MQSTQVHLLNLELKTSDLQKIKSLKPHFLLLFGSQKQLKSPKFQKLMEAFEGIPSFGCSTAGEITNKGLFDESLVINAIRFDQPDSRVESSMVDMKTFNKSDFEAGLKIAKEIDKKDLQGVLFFGPGVGHNPPATLRALKDSLPAPTLVMGGLSADGGIFSSTCVVHNGRVIDDGILAVGFYGKGLSLSHSAKGGWKSFGSARKVTKAKDSVIYEIDHRPALDVYKEALGEHSEMLRRNGIMFPLSILNKQGADTGLIRAVIEVNEDNKSLLVAGDLVATEDSGDIFVKICRSNNGSLIEGAKQAAQQTLPKSDFDTFAVLISCYARRLVMGEATDDEIDAVKSQLSHCKDVTGFYAYGEIGPFFKTTELVRDCQLHNQTMTITFLSEKKAA